MSDNISNLPSFNELEFIKKLAKSFFKDSKISVPPKKIEDIRDAFKSIKTGAENNDIRAQYIVNYLYYNIASDEKRKRKVTARDFEDLIAIIFEGEVTDETKRHNDYSISSEISSEYVARYVVSNLREKSDILFDKFGISVKTSMPDNKEINMGSFAREALFYQILNNYGGERKSGLGSANQMLSVFAKIKELKKWDDFVKRFKEMVTNIFQDDFLFVIKGGSYIEIFTLSAENLQKLFFDAIDSGSEEATWLINRYEGNSIRIKRDPVLERCDKIKIDFDILSNSPVINFKKLLHDIEEDSIDILTKSLSQKEYNDKINSYVEEIKKIITK